MGDLLAVDHSFEKIYFWIDLTYLNAKGMLSRSELMALGVKCLTLTRELAERAVELGLSWGNRKLRIGRIYRFH